MSDVTSVRRPVSVGVVSIFLLVAGILEIIAGILLIVHHNDADAQAHLGTASPDVPHATTLLLLGIAAIVIGLMYIAASRGLWVGDDTWRVIVIFVSVLNIIGLIMATIFVIDTTSRIVTIVTAIVAALVIAALASPKSKEFFGA
ncbi:hypothetical protein ATK17_1376 [Branchiibius hedensis]|uniref:Uncharacterized protein n=1 Tax=Branchiibius hedensis TaxID=672460 RepID=A0A2Y8ZQ71_9MICO|nr:hypothetical protein [Branchiibius hedensis]PWJ25261.1 hypothetical protein ATK17_1376 [Branchiibius hedensis]SSA34075.1 hypothetical protein SAMN04489750_1376 [Branchiibius hedensis]